MNKPRPRQFSTLKTRKFHVKAWQKSNLSRNAYALNNGIYSRTFYDWVKALTKPDEYQIRKKDKLELVPVTFFEPSQIFNKDPFQNTNLRNESSDGRFEIDNNSTERAIRPFVIGRKNWLFADTQAGARATAIMCSIVESARANGLEPFWYFNYLLEKVAGFTTKEEFQKFLPHNVDKKAVEELKKQHINEQAI